MRVKRFPDPVIHWLGMAFALLFLTNWSSAATYAVGDPGSDLVGSSYFVSVQEAETLLDIARLHDIGQEEILLANPGVDRWLPAPGDPVFIPGQHILPLAEREGVVLNLPEMRVYYFNSTEQVTTYPVSIGRMDWKTPLGEARVIRKQENPSWHPPESVKMEAAESGETVPDVVPPGPDNPLGKYALRLSIPGYLIHGTNKPFGVGMRVTHGCVRLLPEDIEALYKLVARNTRVQIVNQPVKVGWHSGVLYIEVHPPMEEHHEAQENLLRYALEVIYRELDKRPAALIGRRVRQALHERTGIPVPVSRPMSTPPAPISNPIFR